jgi:hypothetical protein
MPEPEGLPRAVYDHTEEEPRPAGRRRRQVADWGVGEELFDGMPGRRFERRGDDHRIPRGGVDDGRRTIVIAEGEAPASEPPAVVDGEFSSREQALRAREQHDAVWAGDEPFAEVTREEAEPPLAEERDLAEALAPEPRGSADGIVRGGVEGRRTVKIGGRPPEFHSAPARRRPSRSVHERVGPRPDRIAAWAFALGLLLILIAIATANI